MKKIIIFLAVIASSVISNEMFLVEDYTSGDVEIDINQSYEVTVATISFTLDREAMVNISIGGPLKYNYAQGSSNIHPAIYGCSWVAMNGAKLDFTVGSPEVNGSFLFALDPGSYEFELVINAMDDNIYYYTPPDYEDRAFTIHNPRIQALVILSDTAGGSVSESPSERSNPLPKSLISAGPSITVTGCQEVVDISGRKMECEITGDHIMIETLPKGTYFVGRDDGRRIKLVKM